MPRITEDLVRRRAEHNECDITTLEELSLHQQEIERIEHLDRWCRNLKILYLQNNLIPRIENVGRLKQLEYLNLALNNIEVIENLEGCEFLNKLDLTVNFVGDLLSVEKLQANHHFRELYLTGNPCTDYEGYREFVVATLPQLQWLDGKEVSKSERILATQQYQQIRERIIHQQKTHQSKRELEKREHNKRKAEKEEKQSQPGFDGRWYTDTDSHLTNRINGEHKNNGEGTKHTTEEDDEDQRFWNEPTAYTPESRTEVHQYMSEKKNEKAKSPENKGLEPHKRQVRLERDGKVLNVNEGRYDFQFTEDDENNQYLLEVVIPRYMDTSLVECDVQPTYVRLRIKGKILQLVLDEEVSPDRSSVQRSQTSGCLLVTLPKAKTMVKAIKPKQTSSKKTRNVHQQDSTPSSTTQSTTSRTQSSANSSQTKQPSSSVGVVDIRNIVEREEEEYEVKRDRSTGSDRTVLIEDLDNREGEEMKSSRMTAESDDDSDVPPLI